MQTGLFDTDENKPVVPVINGLSYIPEFINVKEHNELWESINKEIWLCDLKRRVQHYGYKYDYRSRSVDQSMYIGPIPEWSKFVVDRIVSQGLMAEPDQMIINEYTPGQGISDHVDCEPCFEDTIISVSLGSSCIMNFKKRYDKEEKQELMLEPRSLFIIKGDARYEWTHGISAREKDKWKDKLIPRTTRISLTFRKVII